MKHLDNPTVHGASYRHRFQHFVQSVLNENAPHVRSFGTRFYNKDAWTARALVSHMCAWAANNPECCPTMREIRLWVDASNKTKVFNPEIVIARTPDEMPLRTALALVGGAYHEAFHTRYSCRRPLSVQEVAKIVLPRWAQVENWAPYYGMLQEWSNIIEDIRIERRGREEYPGSDTKLHDLQDLIIRMERGDLYGVRSHEAPQEGSPQSSDSLTLIMKTFREIGLGYVTPDTELAIESYQREDAEAFSLVVEGPLAPILREAIALDVKDDLGCLRLAMDVIITLVKEQALKPQSQKDQDTSTARCCPECGAPEEKLVVRPQVIHDGLKNPSKGVLTCTVCGWQTDVDLEDEPDGDSGSNTPNSPGAPAEGASAGDKGDGQDGQSDDNPSGNNGGDPEEDADADPDDDRIADQDTGGDDSLDGAEDSGGEGSDTGDGHGDDSQSGEEAPGEGSGRKPDWKKVADKVLRNAAENPNPRLMDNNQSLEEAIKQSLAEYHGELEQGEAPWNPYRDDLDEVVLVTPSQYGQAIDSKLADLLFNDVRLESAAIRSRLQTMFRARQMTSTYHGLRRGRALSGRRLVTTYVEHRSGRIPTRAFQDRGETIDMSMAAAVVVDESGSMSIHREIPVECALCGFRHTNLTEHLHREHKMSAVRYEQRFPGSPVLQKRTRLEDATRVLMALAEPLTSVGCAVQVSGVRDGNTVLDTPSGGHHRSNGVRHDMIMQFGERFHEAKWRFTRVVAEGSTPLADGVQFGMDSLRSRPETHRFVFVVTDGLANLPHRPVIKWQLRRCREEGICIMGIGIGRESEYVRTLFPEDFEAGTAHAFAEDLEQLPMVLIEKLSSLLQYRLLG